MKKIFFTLILGLIMSFGLLAQNEMWIYNSDGTIKTCKISEVDSINFTANMINMLLYKNGDNNTLSVAAIDSIVFKQIVNPGDGGGGWPGGPGGGSSGSLTLLYSSADLQQGTITVKQGGTITGGENFYGYYTGATYSGETSSKSVTISGMVTTYGSGGGGPF